MSLVTIPLCFQRLWGASSAFPLCKSCGASTTKTKKQKTEKGPWRGVGAMVACLSIMSVKVLPTTNLVDKSSTPALINVRQSFQRLTSPETLVYLHQNSENESLAEYTRNERTAGSASKGADHAWSILNETGGNLKFSPPLLEPEAGEYNAMACMDANHMAYAVVWTMPNKTGANS